MEMGPRLPSPRLTVFCFILRHWMPEVTLKNNTFSVCPLAAWWTSPSDENKDSRRSETRCWILDVDVRMIQEWGGVVFGWIPHSQWGLSSDSTSRLIPSSLQNSSILCYSFLSPWRYILRSFSEKVPMKLMTNFLQIGVSLVTLFGLFSTCV